ncbi:actin-17-related [Anaeramoeba flamelloides]|uniref:Actin-17-related n=1 Tax=Anaeramoeba flamelloides TaxID=1746091 RepID=A0ABQ8XJT7_9EUKA|nr:actin-17-related [Anaeramoeba flamelloides]
MSTKTQTQQTIIIDNGSDSIKAGLGGKDKPDLMVPTVVRKETNTEKNEYYIGEKHETMNKLLDSIYPIERETITHWEEMEMIWSYVLNNLNQNNSLCNIFFPENVCESKASRERKCQIMFETFGVPSIGLGFQPILSLYSVNRTCGVVLDLGHSLSSACFVQNANIDPNSIQYINLGGKDITDYLFQLINKKYNGNYFLQKCDWDIVEELKKEICFVESNYTNTRNQNNDKKAINSNNQNIKIKLSNNKEIEISNGRTKAIEILFNPNLVSLEDEPSISYLIKNSFNNCEFLNKDKILNSIFITGGSSKFSGLVDRLDYELKHILNQNNIKTFSPKDSTISSWVGANKFITYNSPQNSWYTLEYYNENGLYDIHKKFYQKFYRM